MTMASLAESPSHMQTTQSFSIEILLATEERKEKGESSNTLTDTQNVKLGVISNISCNTARNE